MATRSGSKKTGKSTDKRGIKSLPAKTLKASQAKSVKGGNFDMFIKLGDIKGEASDSKPLEKRR